MKDSEPPNRELLHLIAASDDEFANQHWRHVAQFFRWDKTFDVAPSAIGCGVLVELASTVWVFTAAHVLAEFKRRPIWTVVDGEMLRLTGARFRFTGDPAMGDHQQDPIDAAVLPLTGEIPQGLERNALQLTTAIGTENDVYARTILLGIPANRTQRDKVRKRFNIALMPIGLRELAPADYEKLGYRRSFHILLGWPKEWHRTTGTATARRILGASGSPIFGVKKDGTGTVLVGTLMAVATKRGRKFAVGTRIQVHLQLADDQQTLQNMRPKVTELPFEAYDHTTQL